MQKKELLYLKWIYWSFVPIIFHFKMFNAKIRRA